MQLPTFLSSSFGNSLQCHLISKKLIHCNKKRRHRPRTQASSEGQAVFDRLLKACNEVKWKGESIIVLNQIRVEPPYKGENCNLLQAGGSDRVLNEGSLDRVKRIVGA